MTPIDFGYSLTIGGNRTRLGNWLRGRWAALWFRWWCPYPVIDDWRASACIAAGKCGCDNCPKKVNHGN